jgi:hypothetical protein
MKLSLFHQRPFFNLHKAFARLHGGMPDEASVTDAVRLEPSDGFKAAYAEYASATAQANFILQKHGAKSPQFANVDVASMRLFHRVKKMQGLKKSRND